MHTMLAPHLATVATPQRTQTAQQPYGIDPMDLVLLFFLILLNGFFAMAEIAMVSSRDARLQKLGNAGRRGALAALTLKNNPATFLSTVQVGITMVGILSGAIGENALVGPLTGLLTRVPALAEYAQHLALALVVMGLTYVSVVIGELLPKQLGLLAPERVAMLVAPGMSLLARGAKPLVYFFSASSALLLRLMGAHDLKSTSVTNEEIRILMGQGAEAGVFHQSEQMLVANVLHLDEQPVIAIMTHRQDIQVLDLHKSEEEIRRFLTDCPYSRIVACRNGLDDVVGLLRTADLLQAALGCKPLNIEQYLRQPLYVPEYMTTIQLLERLRKKQLQCALVVDEYGAIQGLVTLTDVLTAIVGAVPTASGQENPEILQREDGSWLIDGHVDIERLKATLEIRRELSGEKNGRYHTLAGYVLYRLGRIPRETDWFEAHGYRFEVLDMDNNRVDKILVSRL